MSAYPSYNRTILKELKKVLKQYPLLALIGPRQSGKTTFLRNVLKGYRYISLENPDHRKYAESDTKNFLLEYDHKVIFDEVQNVPKLFSYLQGIVDEKQIMGQYILSGSQNFNLMENITQSLAGRISIFQLYPFDLSEMQNANWLKDDLASVMSTGFYPAIFQRKAHVDRYYANYITTYVKRDLSQLANIQDQLLFQRFIKLCATRAGQLLNFNDLARDAGVSHTTARNWISLLETSFILYMLPPYYNNFSKRIIKSNKLYFHDTGLLCHLLNIRNGKIDRSHHYWGSIFENFVIGELTKQNAHQHKMKDFYFWRDSNGREVDLLFDDGQKLKTFEIKASGSIRYEFMSNLDYFDGVAGKKNIKRKHLIYGGDENSKRKDFDAISWRNIKL